jgi:hypothetical protein
MRYYALPYLASILQAGRLVYLKLHLVQSRAARTVVALFLCVCVRVCTMYVHVHDVTLLLACIVDGALPFGNHPRIGT